ncbi:uncharacterized protein [Arachis hypogaea]|uniref:uncharacterized protein n=1 Tax=Arachis hypogaea TaxID=3818 RepID=UPI003B21ED5E
MAQVATSICHSLGNTEINSSYQITHPKSRRVRHNKTSTTNQDKFQNEEYWHMGDASYECEFCHALFWYEERTQTHYNTNDPKYTLCCRGGQVEIPHLQEALKVLYDLLFGNDIRSKHFCDNIRTYNSMFQFTSMGAKIDRTVANGRGPQTFILYGENYHLMGSLIPQEGNTAKFTQLYVFNTHNEIHNRISTVSGENNNKINEDIVRELKKMLNENNVLVKAFRMVREKMGADHRSTIKLRLLGKRDRDIVVETQSERLQRINQLNPAYLGLQSPLLFPYGEDGYKEDIPLNKKSSNSEGGCQNRGLPHAHILLFLHRDDKYPTGEDIDRIISAKIPDKDTDPIYYEAVEKHMMHGPCGNIKKDSPSNSDKDGCDEVSMYYDYRYISPCEAAWRIFGYNIHYREPSVVRLGFYLPGEQPVVFQDHENLADVARKASVKESMFLGWFEANKKYNEARSLTYAEFSSKFVWKPAPRKWYPRKSHSVIGQIFFVPPGSGEIYYLRLLLNFVRGPTSYEEIRTIDGVLYSTFRDACYTQGLLDDDKEYIDAIEEASH